ncbi:MAG: alanine--tRNA ligase, partial [Bacteroidales bacterium]|nr:alanine--tRNA ligase [Bacteroidales bacterium]
MTSQEIRQKFFDFFQSKQHKIVESAPMVVKNDPTLMFTNAGMNQFKDYFLGNQQSPYPRIADTQKCLRVSGKHNDLEEVGHDTYHHTMFEMLGNWSFGDYFKTDAIDWAWEFLNKEIQLPAERMYATVFGGDASENLSRDDEAAGMWEKYLPLERILNGSKKDNFWEMGDTGPCGPCSEIHIDLRPDAERAKINGRDLVNKDHPQVIEIWNLVFIQFNRKADGQLEQLPARHVDTGMGFERLTMAVQGKTSNYDTDIFQPVIQEIARISHKKYGENLQVDIAMRVIADHLRAISFSIADGQIPSNNKAGYVIRRILRRAVRYGFTFLHLTTPFIHELVHILVKQMGSYFPELQAQQDLIKKVIREEEAAFLRTLESGIKRLDQIIKRNQTEQTEMIQGKEAFELYDTFGFPIDLTELIAKENSMKVALDDFTAEMEKQKSRSREAAAVETGDWVVLIPSGDELFIGYDQTEAPVKITRFRKVQTKGKQLYHLAFTQTPFYAESGGQVGDTGFIESVNERIEILNTVKENNLIIHLSEQLPANPTADFFAVINSENRMATARNHSATHLLHYALRKVVGNHVEQKGSLVDPERLRFDFSHFQKLSSDELAQIEKMVNQLIWANAAKDENRKVPVKEAMAMGAMALFGEKYGEEVRVIRFGDSVELCGGTHVEATGNIGIVKIIAESSIAAGIRRIEAVSGQGALNYYQSKATLVEEAENLFKNQQGLIKNIQVLMEDNQKLLKQMEEIKREKVKAIKQALRNSVEEIGDIRFICMQTELDAASMKDLSFQLKDEMSRLVLLLASAE